MSALISKSCIEWRQGAVPTPPPPPPPPPSTNYLCFTAEQANSTIKMEKFGSDQSALTATLETSTDKQTWTPFSIGTTIITLPNIGSKVYFRGNNETFSNQNGYYSFVMTGKIAGSGNIMSLLDKNITKTTIPEWGFYSLFAGQLNYECASLTSCPELPATVLSEGCYLRMFAKCPQITSCPELPATTLAKDCYNLMFGYCEGLTTLPLLPAKHMVEHCYYAMFSFCDNIKVSTAQTGEYQTPWRIPSEGTGTSYPNFSVGMLNLTGGTFTGDPVINTTYYIV